MKFIGNILWLIFGGLYWSACLFILGAICCVTIIGIPLGLQLFKMAKFVFLPFGKEVYSEKVTGLKTILNIIWAIICGWECWLGYVISGIICCITIIGIPFGKQYFKLANFIFFPLGRNFRKAK